MDQSDLTDGQRRTMLEQWAKQTKSWGARIGLRGALGLGIAGFIAFGALNAVGGDDKDDSDGGDKMSLKAAACIMLRHGEDPELVYSAAKDLAADHPLVYGEDESVAARIAVEQAQALGCG